MFLPHLVCVHGALQVLVHGEASKMARLRAAMTARYKDRDEDVKIHTPRNLETLELSFRSERVAKVSSSLSLFHSELSDNLIGHWHVS